jgi:hypothetical protein
MFYYRRQTTYMRQKTIIPTLVFTFLVTGILIALWAATPVKNSNSGKECLDECSHKNSIGGQADMIWEPLSRQFYSAVKAD